jgi:hypothetical protein
MFARTAGHSASTSVPRIADSSHSAPTNRRSHMSARGYGPCVLDSDRGVVAVEDSSMKTHARARSLAFILPFAAVTAVSCADDRAHEPPAGSVTARAVTDGPPPLCTSNPWDSGGAPCGNPILVSHWVLCDELGFLPDDLVLAGAYNLTLAPSADADGRRTASFDAGNGVTTTVASGTSTNTNTGVTVTNWGVASTVKPDGSTMTFDAVIIAAGPDHDSMVLRFDEPQFNVRNIPTVDPANTVTLCGYRAGKSLGLPPPTDPGSVTVTCGFRKGDPGVAGSSTPPGPTVTSMSEIRWLVTVDPAPPDPARINMSFVLDGTNPGTSFALVDGEATGGFFMPQLVGREANLALRFSYGADSCTLYWQLDGDEPPPDHGGGGGQDGGSGGGKTW